LLANLANSAKVSMVTTPKVLEKGSRPSAGAVDNKQPGVLDLSWDKRVRGYYDNRQPGVRELNWGERVRGFLERYPDFDTFLPPDAEIWDDGALEIYIGSNGELWPFRGRSPGGMPKPVPYSRLSRQEKVNIARELIADRLKL